MTRLALALTRASGVGRMLLLGACTALATGLLLVAVSMLRLPAEPREYLFNLVEEQGLRGGTAFATVLLTLPFLLLLHQVVRLGTATRERRLAALRLAGATPREVRRLGAIEVGLPVSVGAVAGLAVYGLLRAVLGGEPMPSSVHARLQASLEFRPAPVGPSLDLVPTTVGPTWWQTVLVISGVAFAGIVTGWRASRHVTVTPLGLARRQTSPPPRPWSALLILLAVASLGLPETAYDDHGTALGTTVVALAIVGVLGLAPWAAHQAGTWVAGRASTAETLLAARSLVAEPRASGRAAAAVGAICLVSGGQIAILANFLENYREDAFFLTTAVLVAVALLVALGVTAGSLVVHAVESLIDRQRSLAALVAAGTPVTVLQGAQRRAALLTAMPLAIAGTALGSLPLGAVAGVFYTPRSTIVLVLCDVVMVLVVWVAVRVATGAVHPWVVRAARPGNLRTE